MTTDTRGNSIGSYRPPTPKTLVPNVFDSILAEEIDWAPFPALPPMGKVRRIHHPNNRLRPAVHRLPGRKGRPSEPKTARAETYVSEMLTQTPTLK